ncbi:hypothetical protein M8523_21440 [Hyphomicrobiales bacterium BP6-180914]|uniref:Glycosyl transferase family 28 C-terminal domain-containing protein n=2 Tax=Lichenifustis flavocetrariae TaxID=2949735 RepID=A0AA41Z7B5_9HYPH|nr:glycosyltransferase [Lichenifustis flavocetrariae]MCW6510587.1 hypothetical protein [Lichenifustis flavocetrariae]
MPGDRLPHARVLMYSHDTFGLGHLRRCRAIAHALVERFKGVQVLIVSGSSIAGAFDFRTRVDFLKVPSVIKLMNGEYTPLADHTDLQETLDLRRSLILNTAESFQPDIFIVDKEPLGLRGELEPTLRALQAAGTTLVLGLRDVMDSPALLAAEWAGPEVLRKMQEFYHQLWVYGPRDFYDPLQGLEAPRNLHERLVWTGFLRREIPVVVPHHINLPEDALLVTTGGGGDGAGLVRQVIEAYAFDPSLTAPVVLVLGPFMRAEDRDEIRRRAVDLPAFTLVDFDNRLEAIMQAASGVVSMGGYNTFCEILSFDKRALIVPRTRPRQEQLIRARRAAELGLIDMLLPEQAADPALMAAALRRLQGRPRPSETFYGRPLDGLLAIGDLVHDIMVSRLAQRASITGDLRH